MSCDTWLYYIKYTFFDIIKFLIYAHETGATLRCDSTWIFFCCWFLCSFCETMVGTWHLNWHNHKRALKPLKKWNTTRLLVEAFHVRVLRDCKRPACASMRTGETTKVNSCRWSDCKQFILFDLNFHEKRRPNSNRKLLLNYEYLINTFFLNFNI
jgi:hypothetical protein